MRRITLNLFLLLVVVIAGAIFLMISNLSEERPLSSGKRTGIMREQNKKDAESGKKKYVEGEVLVKFKKGVTSEEINKFLSEYKLTVKRIIKGINVYSLLLPENNTVKEVLPSLNQDPRVEYAEPNYLMKLF